MPKCSIHINELFDRLIDDDNEIENDKILIIDDYNINKEYATSIQKRNKLLLYENFVNIETKRLYTKKKIHFKIIISQLKF